MGILGRRMSYPEMGVCGNFPPTDADRSHPCQITSCHPKLRIRTFDVQAFSDCCLSLHVWTQYLFLSKDLDGCDYCT